MDHPFASRRTELAAATEALAAVTDMLTVDGMTAADAVHVLQRCDELVADAAVRAALARNAAHLGLLPRRVAAHADADVASLEKAWWERLRSCDPLAAKHRKALGALRTTLTETCAAIAATEGVDAGASSPSDYSDSDTQSTRSKRSGERSAEHSSASDEDEEESA